MIGKNGINLVTGGGPGVMDASTKGAESGGGETLTVTFYPKNATGFEGRYVGNIPDKEIKTMALFSIQNKVVRKVPPIKVGLERNIQKIFEENLNEILNIIFLVSEYSTSRGRIDSLGIDNNGSPVIIEYKRSQNENVINQGLSYLLWLLDHKADFEILTQKAKATIDIDWTSPRVICVAESYNKFDLDTADLLPINIELLKFRIYKNNILLVELETQQKARISTAKVFDKVKKESLIREKMKYSLENHLGRKSPKAIKIFEAINKGLI